MKIKQTKLVTTALASSFLLIFSLLIIGSEAAVSNTSAEKVS